MKFFKSSPRTALFILLVVACGKHVDRSPSIAGSWELYRMYGGGGFVDTLYPSGNGNLLRFGDGNYQKSGPQGMMESGTYTLSKDTIYSSVPPDLSRFTIVNKIALHHGDTDSHLIHLDRDTLIMDFGAPSYDGVERTYLRK